VREKQIGHNKNFIIYWTCVLTVEEGQPASCTENYFCVLRNYINAHVRDLTHPTEKLSSVTSATDDRNVYIATTLLPPHPVSFKHDQKHFKPSKKLQICISSSNQEKEKVSSFNQFICSFFTIFFLCSWLLEFVT
jgi:hypothetical protein